MTFTLAISPQKANKIVFAAILLPPRLIVNERAKMQSHAGFLSVLLQVPVVLVGQGKGDVWQAIGEPNLVFRLEEIGLEKLVWRQIGFGIPND
jgi:hypothetical protein